jgi:hypothetical protein
MSQQTKDDDVIEIQSIEQKIEYIQTKKSVVIYHYSNSCDVCKQYSSTFTILSKKYVDKEITFLKQEIGKCFVNTADIDNVPCFHFYRSGQFQEKMTLIGIEDFEIETNLNSLRI